jgi:hypothetical protein
METVPTRDEEKTDIKIFGLSGKGGHTYNN